MDNSKKSYNPRLFIGIKTKSSQELADYIATHKEIFRTSNIKWSPAENLHITIHFLGSTPPLFFNRLTLILDKLASTSRSFELKYSHLGYFGDKKPRVLWFGIEDSLQLSALHESLGNALERLGINPENRKYKPHLTLGRVKRIGDIDILNKLTKKQNTRIPPFMAKQISLFESVSTHDGPVYKILHSARLKE